MSIDVGESFRNGLDDVLSPRGVVVGGLLLAYSVANLFVQQSLQLHIQRAIFGALLGGESPGGVPTQVGENLPFALEAALPVVLALILALLLVNEIVRLVGIRLFASDSPDPLPLGDVADGFGDAALKALVVGGLFALVVTFVNLIPLLGQLVGWLLVLAFVYLRQVIALEDVGYVDTVTESFRAFTEDPLPIAGILAALGVVGGGVTVGVPVVLQFAVFPSAPGATVAGLDPQVITSLTAAVLGVVFQVLGVAVVTDAYLQVREDDTAAEATAADNSGVAVANN